MARTKQLQEQPQHLHLDLFAPGLTSLHRAGLAGLWLTLDHFEHQRISIPGGTWEKDERSITLHWDHRPEPFLEGLIAQTFRLDDHGLIWFAPLGQPIEHPQSSVLLHEALLGTFLQNGRTRKALKEPRTLVAEIDEKPWTFTFKSLTSYAHQEVAELIFKGGVESPQELAGWLFPGGVVRYTGFSKDSAFFEIGGRLLLLLYAPIGGVYFRVRQRKEGA